MSDSIKIIGLPNLGNTCYANTAVQIFLRCTNLIHKIKDHCDNSTNSNSIITILKNIILAYETSNYDQFKINMILLLQLYVKMQNIGLHDQCDASLFFNFILSELSELKNDEINQCFKLSFCNVITCKCKNNSFNYQNENFLTVYPNEPLQQLDKLIGKQLTRSAIVNYKCDSCGLNNTDDTVDITEHSILVRTGTFLCINISKIVNYHAQIIPMDTFSITTPNNIEHRIQHRILDDKINKFYLVGFIYHSGNVSFGHYVCYLKYGLEWYLCNDLQITKVDDNNINNLINRATFLLYNKI
jgi:ubiquitin C-terminal hydrolase